MYVAMGISDEGSSCLMDGALPDQLKKMGAVQVRFYLFALTLSLALSLSLSLSLSLPHRLATTQTLPPPIGTPPATLTFTRARTLSRYLSFSLSRTHTHMRAHRLC